jgi:hypothetical protein
MTSRTSGGLRRYQKLLAGPAWLKEVNAAPRRSNPKQRCGAAHLIILEWNGALPARA